MSNFSQEAMLSLYDFVIDIQDKFKPLELNVLDLLSHFDEKPIQEALRDYQVNDLNELKNNTLVIWHDDQRVVYQKY